MLCVLTERSSIIERWQKENKIFSGNFSCHESETVALWDKNKQNKNNEHCYARMCQARASPQNEENKMLEGSLKLRGTRFDYVKLTILFCFVAIFKCELTRPF